MLLAAFHIQVLFGALMVVDSPYILLVEPFGASLLHARRTVSIA